MNKSVNVFVALLVVVLLGGGAFYAITRTSGPTEPNPGSQVGPDDPNQYHSQGGVATYEVPFNCNIGANASSTIFAVKNPFPNATSTLTYASIDGVQGATTTDIVIATSTVASPAWTTTTATSSLNENIIGINVTALAKFSSVAGISIGGDSNYNNPGLAPFATSQSRVVVAPGQWIVGFSTSTSPSGAGGRAAAQVAVPSSCKGVLTFKALR